MARLERAGGQDDEVVFSANRGSIQADDMQLIRQFACGRTVGHAEDVERPDQVERSHALVSKQAHVPRAMAGRRH
ncbi:hypothetical protein [Xanthomonas theicola]|uniref:hypothetical protein n=1 Tax=Xanthomonas theicola TaxID=56464 RepID=UPI000FF88989|nr:hypothetical protein [Xanthomonas theicola]QNH26831.1 hypothetical protein G4Q83_21870 [Xanthomonas theicola]